MVYLFIPVCLKIAKMLMILTCIKAPEVVYMCMTMVVFGFFGHKLTAYYSSQIRYAFTVNGFL